VPAKEKVLAVVQEAGCLIENFNPRNKILKGILERTTKKSSSKE
jgi:hypothetical protein